MDADLALSLSDRAVKTSRMGHRPTAPAAKAADNREVTQPRSLAEPIARDREQDEAEFMRAMQEYKAQSGRMFPTWSEVLEVLKSLGYEKSQIDELRQ